jgi:hypothetical protein
MDTPIAQRAPHPLVAWIRRWTSKARPAQARRALERPIARAYQRLALEHPRWAHSLFDHFFLLHHAAPLLARLLDARARVEPVELALAWLAQSPSTTKLRAGDLSELTRAATDFLSYLEEELQPFRARDKAVQRRTSGGNDDRTAPESPASSREPGAEEITRIQTLYTQALREEWNEEIDWLWLASQLPPNLERRQSLERALSINPESKFARRELAKLPSNLSSISAAPAVSGGVQ